MKHTVSRSLYNRTAILTLALGLAGSGICQTPTPAAITSPTPAAATPAPAGSPEAAASLMEPVRQAIANQDYEGAKRALDAIRSRDPENPHIAVYESIINARQSEAPTVGLRTPRAGVTPGPTPEATPTPAPTPVPTPSLAPAGGEAPAEGMAGKAKALLDNPNVLYGLIGLAALIVLGIIFLILKKRKAAREMHEPIQSSSMGASSLGGMEDYSGAAGGSTFDPLGSTAPSGLATSPLSTDYTTPSPTPTAYGSAPESTDSGLGGAAMGGGLAGGGLAGAGGMSGYTVPTFGDEDEESAPPPPKNLRPAPAPDDDAPVSLTDDEPAPAPSPAAEPSPLAGASSGEGLGINFDALGGVDEPKAATPPPADFARPDDDTVIVSSPSTPTPTPTSTPSMAPGDVDLSDIFGEQTLPGEHVPFSEQPTFVEPVEGADDRLPALGKGVENVPFSEQPTMIDEDANSQTLPTFVSTPGTDNPEEDVEVPPKPARAPKAEEDHTISFEELFGPQGMAAEPEPEPEPAPAPKEDQFAKPSSEISIEDALAATLGAMQEESPDEAPAPAASAVPDSTESLDERSERMFREQMDKARKAYDEKNWRQAVHFLSIASALHPENEEAKQMLKDARGEKRKAEESV